MKLSRNSFSSGLAVLCLLTLAGCATVKESYGPDGRKAYALNCSGTARGWDKCLAAAGDICGSAGYDVLDKSSEAVSIASAAASNGSFGASAVKTSERTMLVACKAR